MVDDYTTSTVSVDHFWEQFVDRARKYGVKETAIRWYGRHAERYLKAFSGKRLAAHSLEDVPGYCEAVGRIDRIQDWQFAQIFDAVRTLAVGDDSQRRRGRGGLCVSARFGTDLEYDPPDDRPRTRSAQGRSGW